MRFTWIPALLVLAVRVSHAEVVADTAWIEAARAKYDIPGVAIAVVERDKPVQFHAAGLCDVERAVRCTEHQRFPIGSVTKSITGLIAAVLASESKVDLDVPAVRYWPQLRLSDDRTRALTLRDLLIQQSGLGSVDWPYFWDASLTRDDYLARLAAVPPARPFRAGFSYANANFVLAGKILEAATGSTWESLVMQRLLRPLGMSSSGFDGTGKIAAGFAPTPDGRLIAVPFVSPPAIGPAGALVTTAADFSRLIAMLIGEGSVGGRQILPAEAINAALSTGGSRKKGGYGLGIGFTHFRDELVFHHLGSMAGHSAAMLILPGRWGVVVLTNRTASTFPEGLAFALLDRYMGQTGDETLKRFGGPLPAAAAAPAGAVIDTPKPVADLTGTYGHAAWGEFTVEASGSQLHIRFGTFAAAMDREGGESYSFLAAPGWERIRITFQRDVGGRVTGFSMADGSNEALQFFARTKA